MYKSNTTLFLLLLLGCSSIPIETELIGIKIRVNAFTQTCQGIVEMDCMLIQQGDALGTSRWDLFYDTIEGFNFVPSNIYELDVTLTEVPFPPADTSSLKYSLNKILSKTKVNLN